MPDPHVQAALQHVHAGRWDQARVLLRRILQREPKNPAANQLLAVDCHRQGLFDQALYHIDRAIVADPAFADFHFFRGSIKNATPDWPGAIASLRRAIELNPQHVGALALLGAVLLERADPEEAETCLRRALQIAPTEPAAAVALARLLTDTCRVDEALALLRRSVSAHPRDVRLASVFCFTLNYAPAPAKEVLAAHARFGSLYGPAPRAPADDQAGRRLRIGLLSPDLRTHSVSFFLEPLIEHIDRAAFELFAYHTGGHEDETTARLRSLIGADHWRAAFPPRPESVAQTVRADRIDMLIDLAAHASQNSLGIFALRPAPLQATWLGYPNTTGLSAIDYRLVDSITDPSGSESLVTERLVRLDPCFLCYRPLDGAHPLDGAPEGSRPTTFVSFNNPAKLSDPTIDLWSRILSDLPGSRLLLKAKTLASAPARQRLIDRFAVRGLASSCIVFLPPAPTVSDHLATYAQADIALDPFPYNGTTTTCEALSMGVPVITLLGDRHAARVGASLLSAAGFPEWIAPNIDAYAATARSLAADRPARTAIRKRLLASALCDAPAFARRFGEALRRMWAGTRQKPA